MLHKKGPAPLTNLDNHVSLPVNKCTALFTFVPGADPTHT